MIPILRPRRAGVAAAALSALLIAACGNTNNVDTQSNTTTVSTPVRSTPTEQAQPQFGRTFTANPAIVNPRPIPFDSWSRVAPDRIAVNFQIGSPDCYGVDETTTETDSTVTVTLRAGALPAAAGRMCTMIAVFGTLEVQLKQPLGTRNVRSAA
jgi:hypothetical protein